MELKDLFDDQGYLVLENFASDDECSGMMSRMEFLLEGFDPQTISVFSTKNQKERTDNYFFESANNISFFFEEKAFDPEGKLKQPKSLSINKVGHALHELDPVFKSFTDSKKVGALLELLGYKKPVLMQSMYIFKQPGIGGEVVPHQDNSFLYTDPPSCTGLWLALEDANKSNGCLWVLPKSHRDGVARKFLRDENGVKFDKSPPTYEMSQFIPVEVKAGSLVVIHGNLVHQSFENKSSKSRHAYSVHVVESEDCVWSSDNWIRKKNLG
ncbi:phytanoyl-CoA dioxygenase [Selaginella moellendorffii]|uniref:phytanoyl-CoA dioxygenase n=1 Tax=Selaginella moellendorffii TaxID=88036 RepID=UPI000D1D0292|nr:phytanoyl-CoA dioxygenase [Selaginella moellendorffii]|eukprot:XP_024535439.1 phytanoyl-CoA dioxygenase [Selaginella moellendorffii]